MSGNASFPKKARLRESLAYATALVRKRIVKGKFFRVYVNSNNAELARLGMIVSKRAEPSAAKRNRCRRLIREAFRRMRADLPQMDIIVRLNAGIGNNGQVAVREDISAVLRRAAILFQK